MRALLRSVLVVVAASAPAPPLSAQDPGVARRAPAGPESGVPRWVSRGLPGKGHAALAPLVGSWRVELNIHGTIGRSPDRPPIVSRDIRTTRVWIADGQYVEDT